MGTLKPNSDRASAEQIHEWLGRVAAREPRAWQEFVQRMGPVVQSVVRSMLRQWGRPPHDADDIIQDVYCKLLKDGGAILLRWSPERGPLDPYLRMVARTSAIDFLRPRWRETLAPDTSIHGMTEKREVANRSSAAADWVQDAVRQYLEQASDGDRAFLLDFLATPDPAALAERQALAIDATYQRISRLRRRIMEIKGKQDQDR